MPITFAASGPMLITGQTPSAEAAAFLARTTGTLSNAERQGYIACINYWVDQGVFSMLDAAYIFATNSKSNALLSLINSTYNATEVGTLTFTADSGFNSTSQISGTSWIDTNFNPSTAPTPHYRAGSVMVGAYTILDNAQDNQGSLFSSASGDGQGDIIRIRDTADMAGVCVQAAFYGAQFSNVSTKGCYALLRNGTLPFNTSLTSFKNEGIQTGPDAPGSGGFSVRNSNMLFLGLNASTPDISTTAATVSAGFIGGGDGVGTGNTNAQIIAICHGLNLYMTSLGINAY